MFRSKRTGRINGRRILLLSLAACLLPLGWGLHLEMQSSPLQSQLFGRLTRGFSVKVEVGASPSARFPVPGPYDQRLGYARMPEFLERLAAGGFAVDSQARLSPTLIAFIDHGGFPIYREKAQAGLGIRDRWGQIIYGVRHPERVFPDFEAIAPLVVATLLFIENRELLDLTHPTRNPVVEWDRFAAASSVLPVSQRLGGSTLATQIEKFRHSRQGRTGSAAEKLRQIVSASARAYRDGPDTTRARKRIVLDYVNSTPLAGRPGFGEVIGLGDGLHAWYGKDLDELTSRLGQRPPDAAARARGAQVYKQILSLLLAQRRPSH